MKLDGVITSVLLVMSIGLTGIAACTSRTREQPQTDEEAVRLVKRFVAAETIGDEATTLSLLAVHRCEVIPTSDAIRPTVAAEFGAAIVSADTTRVPVRYFVLGIGHVDELVDSSVRVKFRARAGDRDRHLRRLSRA